MTEQPDTTTLVGEAAAGRSDAAERLMGVVYDELCRLADGYLRRERPDHTLQATALVHEAYMKLVDQTRVDWQGQTHFKAVAAQAMQRVLIDHARSKGRQKRGGGWRKVAMDDAFSLAGDAGLDLLALHDALERMKSLDPRQAQVVRLRVFGGLTNDEAAGVLDVSTRTVERDWKMGVAWLRRELGADQTNAEPS